MINQAPPHNKEAEQSVLSALFIDNTGFEKLEGLKPDDFYAGAHKTIYRAMINIRRKNEPVDLVLAAKELEARGELERVGGSVYLSEIADSAPVALNVKYYAKIIQDLATVRQAIITAHHIVEQGYCVQNVEDYIGKAQSDILNLQTTTSQDKIYTMREMMDATIDRIDAAKTADTEIGYKLGMPFLDKALQVYGSKLALLAGRPGMGKTALALSMARHLAGNGVKVGFLSIEMDQEQLSDRLLSAEANVNPLCFYAKDSLTDQSFVDLMDAAGVLSDIPIYVDDADCQIQDVERKCRKMRNMGCEIIFIDQLSKIRGGAKKSKFEIYTDNCSAIALLKKELRIPIFLLCQLNRNVEQRENKRPMLSDLKQTGMLEEDADMVFLLYRPGYYEKDKDPGADQSRTEINLAKNRQGAVGVEYNVLFRAKRAMFEMKGLNHDNRIANQNRRNENQERAAVRGQKGHVP